MILSLKNPNGNFPHQGWPFKDERTGFTCNGFEGTPQMQSVKIIAHRRANPHVYPTTERQWFDEQSVIQEVYRQKFKTHPHLFVGHPDKAVTIRSTPAKVRSIETHASNCTCGALSWSPRYCKTCSGKKVVGFKCNSCGREIPR